MFFFSHIFFLKFLVAIGCFQESVNLCGLVEGNFISFDVSGKLSMGKDDANLIGHQHRSLDENGDPQAVRFLVRSHEGLNIHSTILRHCPFDALDAP